MRDTLIALFRLQEIDSRALEIERMGLQIPQKISDLEAEVDVKRVELGAVRAEVDEERRNQSELEANIREESAKIQKWKRRLNDIRTPREYQALSREVEQSERLVRDLEEQVLSLMESQETKGTTITGLESDLSDLESLTAGKIAGLRDQKMKFDAEAEQARHGRDEIIKHIPEKLMNRYNKVVGRRQGIAVALIEGGCCSGCNVQIRAQKIVEIRRLDAVATCEICHRILVLDSLVRGESED